ncbi:MAG: site-specific integrase [Pseudomonadota bacterium]
MSKPKKRKGSPYYWYDFTVGTSRFRGSTQTSCYETAKSIIIQLRADKIKCDHFGPQKPKITFDNAIGRYILEHAQYLKSFNTIQGHCKRLSNIIGKDTLLNNIDDCMLNNYVNKRRLMHKANSHKPISYTTVNREIEVLRKIIFLARDKWKVEIGDVNFKQHFLRTPEARTRWISREEANDLINCSAEHLRAIIRFALLTGLRFSNIVGLQWEDINFNKQEINFQIKSNIPGGKLLTLPITEDIYKIFDSIGQMNKGYVFKYNDRPIKSVKRSFKTACKKAKLKDFRFHDLRHTAASWMVQSGIPIDLVKEVLGHTNIYTTSKYAHRNHNEKLEALKSIKLMTQS